MTSLLSVDDARKSILDRVRPLPPESVALAQAAGRVLAQDAFAAVDLPPFPSSAMDGFAVRAADTPARLDVPAADAGAHVRPRGGDLGAGDLVVERGTLLRPAELAALAAAGIGDVTC